MRGILGDSIEQGRAAGITPAHAGNTARVGDCSCPCWDHPRACGEYVHDLLGAGLGIGITPAHAGNTVRFPVL